MSKPITPPSSKVDWATMGFQYRDLNGFMRYTWTEENGWDNGRFETNPKLDVHMCSTGLNYGQQCFEGLKAFRDSEGRVRVFRPEDNAERMMHSADIGHMPHVPKEIFLEGIKKTVEANLEFVPPKETGGSLYIRPLLFGSGPFIGMGPAPEFTFVVFAMPVGPYYSGGVKPVDAVIVEDFDRSAPNGTGSAKLGGNYAPTLAPMARAKKNGYPLTLHLDAKTHTLIDEFSTSNFVGLTYPDAEGKRIFVTPDSNSILKSVTRRSLAAIAQKFGWGVEERPVALKEVEEGKFAEVAACGTAAIITPVKKIVRGDQVITIGSQDEIGEGFKKLYDEYRGIQGGDVEDTFNWLWPKEGFKGLAHEKTQLHVQEPVLTLENTKTLSSKYDFAITNPLPIWTKKDLEFFKTAAGETVFSQLTVIPEPGVIPNFSTMTSAERLFKSLFHYFDQRLTEDPTQDVTADPSWTFYERLENALYPWLHPHWENAFHLVNETEGQGIVLCVGNGQFKFAASTIRVLREILHTQLPIEVFFIREDDLSVAKRFYLSSEFTDVTLRKLDEAIGDYYTRFGGWAMKPFAMLASRFTEVIMMDADAFFLQDPTDLFDDLGYKTAGSLFFYDRTLFPNWNLGPDWLRSFLPTTSLLVPKTRWFQGTSSHEQESGVIVMNKRKSLLGLLSACKLNGQNERDQVVYRHVHGDKETFWIGHEITQTPYAFIKSFGAVIGNMGRGGEDGEPTQVCGVQLHLDTESRPLWFNGGLYRNKYKEPLEYLNFTHFAQGEHWEFATHCIKDTDKISELGPDQRTVALAAIEIDKQREKDQALLDQGRWKPKGYP